SSWYLVLGGPHRPIFGIQEFFFFFFQAEDGIRDFHVTGVQTCALPICKSSRPCSPLASTRARTSRMRPRRSTPIWRGPRRLRTGRTRRNGIGRTSPERSRRLRRSCSVGAQLPLARTAIHRLPA